MRSLPSSTPLAVGGLLVVNLVPLVGVLAFGWSLHALLVIYWLESGVIGALNVPKILLASGAGGGSFSATINGRPVDLSGPETRVDGPHFYAENRPIAGFFVLHYGIFWIVHGVFVLFALPAFAGGTLGGFSPLSVLVGVAGMVLSHGASFLFNFVEGAEYRSASPSGQMADPYRRVFVLHFTIIFGAFVVASVGAPVLLVVLLVALKTGADLVAHLWEHRRAAKRRRKNEAETAG